MLIEHQLIDGGENRHLATPALQIIVECVRVDRAEQNGLCAPLTALLKLLLLFSDIGVAAGFQNAQLYIQFLCRQNHAVVDR